MMSDQEVNYDPKPEDNLLTDDKVNEGQKSSDGEEAEPSNSPTQTTQPNEPTPAEDEAASTPDSSTESKPKPKKAQRTHRVQLPVHQGSENSETVPSNMPSQSGHSHLAANLESISHSGNSQVPVQIPPQIIAFHNDDPSGDDSQDKESAFVMTGLCAVGSWIAKFFVGVWCFTTGLLKSLARLLLTPALLGAVIYCVMVYTVFTFGMQQKEPQTMAGFDAAMKHVLQNCIWLVLPVSLSFLVIHFNSDNRHHQFLYESVVDVTLMLINSLIMTCHAEPDTLLWLGPMFIVAVAFRFIYWLSLFYLQPKWQQLFHTPTILNCVVLTVYNIGVSIQANASGLFGSFSSSVIQDPVDGSSTQDPGSEESVTSGQEEQGFFTSSSMCDIAERLFCGADKLQ